MYSIPPYKRSPHKGILPLNDSHPDILGGRRPVGFVRESYPIRGGTLEMTFQLRDRSPPLIGGYTVHVSTRSGFFDISWDWKLPGAAAPGKTWQTPTKTCQNPDQNLAKPRPHSDHVFPRIGNVACRHRTAPVCESNDTRTSHPGMLACLALSVTCALPLGSSTVFLCTWVHLLLYCAFPVAVSTHPGLGFIAPSYN
jgi:hypothetical protein